MNFWMPTGLPGPSSMKIDLGQARDHRLAVAQLELGLDGAADHLLRRHPIHLLAEGAHELDAAARHDVGLEAVRPQVASSSSIG